MSSSPTIRDIAEKLGIGKSTVQRALTGQGNISAATRERVIQIAKEIGYHPDPLFSSLASQRTRQRRDRLDIAYIHAADAHAGTPAINEVSEAAESLGYRAHEIIPAELDSGNRLMDVLYHRGFVGAIIGPVRTSLHATILNNRHLPMVCCGRIEQLPLHTVQPDITDSFRDVWAKVTAAGYRRIGAAICMHKPRVEDDLDRLGAALVCLQDLPASRRIPPLTSALMEDDALIDWFKKHRPDAIVGFSVRQYYVLKDAGIDVENIGFASLHVTEPDAHFCGIEEAAGKVANEAVHMLNQFIRRRDVGIPSEPLHLLIPGRWNNGVTLPGPGKTARIA